MQHNDYAVTRNNVKFKLNRFGSAITVSKANDSLIKTSN